MLKIKSLIPNFEKDDNFAKKVLIMSFPSALLFFLLTLFKVVSPTIAISSIAAIIFFNIVMIFPLTLELQQIKKYIQSISENNNIDEKILNLSEKNTQDIVNAVNDMHRFWAHKADKLEAQTMSDTAVLDSLPDPIIMLDRSGYILGANFSARSFFGKNITNKNIDKIFSANNFINAVSRVLNKESQSENLIFYINKPIEQKLYAHIKQLPWISKGKAIAVISFYDLTKSMKIEKMQSDFVANASHELRTPLSIISGFIETLQTSAKDDEEAREKFLKIIRDQTDYMSALIENLLSLSKIELNQDNPPNELVDVLEITEEVAEALSLKAQSRNIKIKIELDEDITDIIADKEQIKQVIQNLTENAIKYGLSASDVILKIRNVDNIPTARNVKTSNEKGVAISVNNKGPKIESENLARITERFFRLQEHKDMNIKGTGLGLAIVKHIIMRHKGNLTVTSNMLNGTTFTVYLPLLQTEN